MKKFIQMTLGNDAYRGFRAQGIRFESSFRSLRNQCLQRITNKNISVPSVDVVVRRGVSWQVVSDLTVADALEANFNLVRRAFNNANVSWWLVEGTPGKTIVLGVDSKHRSAVLAALAKLGNAHLAYSTVVGSEVLLRHISKIQGAPEFAEAGVIAVLEPKVVQHSTLQLGLEASCQIEFWDTSDTAGIQAPRENRASMALSKDDFHLVPTTFLDVPAMIPSVLTKRMLDDVVFPVDAVYTWVDGEDPAWLESKRRTEAEVAGVEYHGEANHAARFRSRDELKYSLRSLEMYAPWFRKIFIVTAGQVPDWLDTSNPKIQLIDHKDIYPESGFLPTFNSNSIISRLHHIEGLSEHYVYINDDVFFGRALSKDRFFLPNGIAKVSPSNNRRPFGDPTAQDEPHFNLTRNMRILLEERFGITISRAIKHTPHPQLRSVHFEMEEAFREVYEQTWASRFRHHTDIVADQLHHYYAQIVGKAVPTNLRYNYINILDDKYKATMDNTLRLRHRDTFCINDAPVEGATPIPEEQVTEFLDAYFPVKSSFEK